MNATLLTQWKIKVAGFYESLQKQSDLADRAVRFSLRDSLPHLVKRIKGFPICVRRLVSKGATSFGRYARI